MFTCNFLPLQPCGLRLNNRFIWTGTRTNNIQGLGGADVLARPRRYLNFPNCFSSSGFVIGAGGWSKSLPRRLSEVSHLLLSMTNFTLQMSRLNRPIFSLPFFFFERLACIHPFNLQREKTSGFFGQLPPSTTRSHSLQKSHESEWFVPLCCCKRN